MARIFITGSSTGIGLLAARQLIARGQSVVLHARNTERADEVRKALPAAEAVITGDIETIRGAVAVAESANAMGRFDAVIHNAGIGYGGDIRRSEEGIPSIFAVNALAPYILTSLISRPTRLIYLSSSMHQGTRASLGDAMWQSRRWNGAKAYSESKLYILLLAFAIRRLWPETRSNGVDPGWVPTRMGGAGAPDDLDAGATTQAALAVPEPGSALTDVTGQYLHHMRIREPDPQSRDQSLQDEFLTLCEKLSGIRID